ncbi:hypothetical protein AB0J74_30315 [Asanoa sp. NPDC049573]|uniref:hypothetical protein n=1 Tax=Asanoa sp. NPDC049573 TaxID=3155396 RepID=UPI003445D3F9
MSTVTALSNLAKDSLGPDPGLGTIPFFAVVIGLVMFAAVKLFGQVGEAFVNAVQLLRIAIAALGTATLLVAAVVVMAVVVIRA